MKSGNHSNMGSFPLLIPHEGSLVYSKAVSTIYLQPTYNHLPCRFRVTQALLCPYVLNTRKYIPGLGDVQVCDLVLKVLGTLSRKGCFHCGGSRQCLEDARVKEGHQRASNLEPGLGVSCPDLTAEYLLPKSRQQSRMWRFTPIIPARGRW